MARPSLHMSKCHIVGNLMHWLISCLVDHLIFAHFLNILFICKLMNETKNQFLYLLLSRHAVQIFSLKQTLTVKTSN